MLLRTATRRATARVRSAMRERAEKVPIAPAARRVLTGGVARVSRSAMPRAARVSNLTAGGRMGTGLIAGMEMGVRRKTASIGATNQAAAATPNIAMAIPPEKGMPMARPVPHVKAGPAGKRRSPGATGRAAAAFIPKRRAESPHRLVLRTSAARMARETVARAEAAPPAERVNNGCSRVCPCGRVRASGRGAPKGR